MSDENIIGLMGELLFLRKLIDHFGTDAIDYWVADRGEEDFVMINNIVEVKCSLKEKHEHIINGIDQLMELPSRSKIILSLLLVESEKEDDFHLPKIIMEITDLFFDSPSSLDSFYTKLRNRGYDPRDEKLYLDHTYKLYKGGYFKVDESFPKLTTKELKQPLNSRISKVRYTIDMEGLSNRDFNTTLLTEVI
jgi:hypothetical protein